MPKSKKKQIPEFERGRERGRREGSLAGYEFLAVIVLMVLKDKHDMSGEELEQIWAEIRSYTEMINKGTVSFKLMEKTLTEEYGISFHWHE